MPEIYVDITAWWELEKTAKMVAEGMAKHNTQDTPKVRTYLLERLAQDMIPVLGEPLIGH